MQSQGENITLIRSEELQLRFEGKLVHAKELDEIDKRWEAEVGRLRGEFDGAIADLKGRHAAKETACVQAAVREERENMRAEYEETLGRQISSLEESHSAATRAKERDWESEREANQGSNVTASLYANLQLQKRAADLSHRQERLVLEKRLEEQTREAEVSKRAL